MKNLQNKVRALFPENKVRFARAEQLCFTACFFQDAQPAATAGKTISQS